MKTNRSFPAATITPRAEASLRAGHPWVYDSEVLALSETPENGGLVDILNKKGAYLGTGFYSGQSKLRLRLLAQNANESFGPAFFSRRVGYALAYRQRVMGPDYPRCCRLIFGEADGLPGLTVDRFGDLLVAEVLSAGVEAVKHDIYRALCETMAEQGFPVAGIYERNESTIREREGLPRSKGWVTAPYVGVPASPVTEIVENGVRYRVDVENGQKTGFFLDQKRNRRAAAALSPGLRVLDCFTHTGSFALNAALGGAAHVTAVDVSQTAVDMARENAALNGLTEKMDFVCADVFDLLPELLAQKARYDFIILDPPAFTKSRKTTAAAARGYKEINYRAMRLLPRGGYLATASCSHFMSPELFQKTLLSAARDAGVTLRLIEARRAAPDHPTLPAVPETDYLKFMLFQLL